MAIRDKLTSALRVSGDMCDDCLAAATAVKPRQTVNAYCRGLHTQNQLLRIQRQCPGCKGRKVVNVLLAANRTDGVTLDPVHPSLKETVPNAASSVRPWYWEGNVQDRIKTHLEATGWVMVRTANTELRDAGKDIVATNGAEQLAEVERLWGSKVGTPNGDRLDVLLVLVENYEAKHHPIDPPDPVDAIKFRMEQLNLTRKDLEPLIGPRGRVAEVLNRRRPLSLAMIRSLLHKLHIPLESLIASSVLAASKRTQRSRQSVTRFAKRKRRATSPRR